MTDLTALDENDPGDRTVLVAGATSSSGTAIATALARAGFRVIALGRTLDHLKTLGEAVPGIITHVCDVTDADALDELVRMVHTSFGPIDGLINLVGGWRGGSGIADQSDEDWEFLSGSLTALRLLSRAFYDDLVASDEGRLAIVSSISVLSPTAGNANYVALKTAAEAWMRAVADGFGKANDKSTSNAAATIFRVKVLAGLEDVLAASIVGLWDSRASAFNGRIVSLT